MFFQNYNYKNSLFDINIFIGSFLIVFFKWFSSFLLFQDENLINKILFDISDIYYFPFIFNISELNFSPDYLNNIKSDNFIPLPIYSIILHSIFFKIVGLSSFIILELIFLYFFLILIHKILINCKINYCLALFISILIFTLPSLVSSVELFGINLNNIEGIFSFRFPRPLVTSCYFFWGIYLTLIYYKNEKFDLINFLYLGLCFSLVLVSYYYNFINLLILIFLILFTKILSNKNYFKNNFLYIFYSILVFLLFTIPFIYLYLISEKDFSSMIGVITLNNDLKLELLSYFLTKLFSLKFVLTFLLITFLRFFLIKFQNQVNHKVINFFYYLFLASIFSPFFFTIISPSISEIYHFLNWIVIISVFVFIIYFSLFLNFMSKNFLTQSIKIYNSFFVLLSIFLIFIFQFLNYQKVLNDTDKILRNDYSKLQIIIDSNSNKLNNLLSFSIRPQVLWMLKGKKEFSSIESSISSLNFQQLENNFLQNLRFLNVNPDNFAKLISNKKSSWRYNNDYIKYISWYKYQANSLITFKNTNDFSQEELEYIASSRPTKTQQIILPKFEFDRLTVLFENIDLGSYSKKPDLIILSKESLIYKYSNLNTEEYCQIKNFDRLKVFTKIDNELCD